MGGLRSGIVRNSASASVLSLGTKHPVEIPGRPNDIASNTSPPQKRGHAVIHKYEQRRRGKGCERCRAVCGRSTFAVLAILKGMPLETLQKVLGHKSILSTQVYAELINPKVGEDTDRMCDKIGSVYRLAN